MSTERSPQQSNDLAVPDLSLVVLIGASGSGKSTFAARHFLDTEVISSDRARGMVGDDENDQSVTDQAFQLLHHWAGLRLELGRLTVIDATNVQAHARKQLVQLAKDHDVLPVAIVLDTPAEVCQERNRSRSDRNFGPHVIRRQRSQLKKSLRHLKKEGFRHVHHLEGLDQIAAAHIVRQKRWTDLRDRTGPFDIIGDIHGCHDELVELLETLGYRFGEPEADIGGRTASHPEGRTAVFVGDLVDRGPGVVETLQLVMNMTATGAALCVAGNHENKLLRALRGRNVQQTHGLPESLEQLERADDTFPAFTEALPSFLDGLLSHYLLDGGRLVVAHAGLPERFHNRSSGRVRSFCLYGETTGETDEFGLPVRYRWADDYRGDAAVVYGHTPVPTAEWHNNTICLDTGCVFGGRLTALRWPERELVSVEAHAQHYEPIKPLGGPVTPTAADREAEPLLLDLTDVTGRRHVETSLMGRLAIDEGQNAAALELTSRFTVDPRWLAYLPPTMAPVATATEGDLLERPQEAFEYYASQGVDQVICQEKHMGSRAVAIVARTPEALRTRFGLDAPGTTGDPGDAAGTGLMMTRTGRQFFDDPALGVAVINRLRDALEATNAWERHGSDWFLIDGELLPWSAKAGPLIRNTFASVGAAGQLWAPAAVTALEAAVARGVDGLSEVLDTTRRRGEAVDAFRDVYRTYVSATDPSALQVDDLSFAPFTLLAADGEVLARRDNSWQMDQCDLLVDADPGFIHRTARRVVDLDDEVSRNDAVHWWATMTDGLGEGMVVKPLQPVSRGKKGLIQPGLKCRGREYLRLVYGPEYGLAANLPRLRDRRLNRKRSLALREFTLGLEALDRFVAQEPLWRVHQCVFSILALESDPVDPRL